jgi:hypothetical protein
MTKLPPPATLQNVLDALPGVTTCTAKAQADMASAIHVFCRDLGRQPAEVPAQIDVIERLGRDLNAASLGITQGRLANIRSMVRRALRETGHQNTARRLDFPLEPTWKALSDLPADSGARMLLRRLFRIFQLKGIEPDALSPAAFEDVRQHLHVIGDRRADATYREFVIAWNSLSSLLRPYRT